MQIDMNDARDILINGKLFRGMEQYIFQKEKGGKIFKKKLHWTNAVWTDLKYPITARHFAFGFETTDLENLLNFEYSLLDEEGKLTEFKTGEDKIPATNFTFQIIN